VTGYDTPFPAPGQEDYYVPNAAKVLDAIKQVMEP
jgi:pyruvate dehydrogenase E1 component beta subunit